MGPCRALPTTFPLPSISRTPTTFGQGIEIVRKAEARGFDAVWQADSRLVRDAVVPMAAFAATTDRIKIGSGVIDIWTRNAARLASTFSTLDDLAPGRILCGLGAWWDPLASRVGIDRAKPLRVMREVVTAVRGLLANETVSLDGHHVHLDGVELDYVYQERRAKDVPIYIGATGMQMMEMTGEIADGAVLNYLVDPAYNVAGDGGAGPGRGPGRTQRRRHRPPAARGVQRRSRPSGRARCRPAAGHPVPRSAAPPDEGVRACPRNCWTTSAR